MQHRREPPVNDVAVAPASYEASLAIMPDTFRFPGGGTRRSPLVETRIAQTAQDAALQVVGSVDAGIWLFSPIDGRVEFVNPGYERLLGVGLDELQINEWAWLANVHPDDRARVRAEIELTPAGLQTEYRVRASSGGLNGWRFLRAQSATALDASGVATKVAGVIIDVTALRAAKSQLDQMSVALERTREGVVLLDANWQVTYVNNAFEGIAGLSRESMLGVFPPASGAGPDLVPAPLAAVVAAVAAGRSWNGPLTWTNTDGSAVVVQASVWPLFSAPGQVSSIVCIVRPADVDVDRLAASDQHDHDRKELSDALKLVDGSADATTVAKALLGAMFRMDDIDTATVKAFVSDGLVIPLAVLGPSSMPLVVGQSIPHRRADYLRDVSGQGPRVLPFMLREIDGDYGRRWADTGTKAVAYLPLIVDGAVAGVLTAGSTMPDGVSRLEQHLEVLAEYANLISAVLGPHLRRMRSVEERRSRLEQVISGQEFSIVFQPITDTHSRATIGFEALTRFNDGTPPQHRFIEADAAFLGIEMETATLRAAALAARSLAPDAWLSLNVSPEMLGHPGILRGIVREAHRPVVIELTEHAAVADYRRLRTSLASLGRKVRLAVDDAGSGFASMRHIVELKPGFVKIDIGLVRGINHDQARQALVAGMAHFAGKTHCTLIAEGIETEAELRTLRLLGVSLGQGYLLGRPTPTGAAARRAKGPSGQPTTVPDQMNRI